MVCRQVGPARYRDVRQFSFLDGGDPGVSDNRASEAGALGVVVVTHNSAAIVGECLASVRTHGPSTGVVTTIVVDSGSTDDSIETAEAVAGTRVVSLGRNAGYAAGVNAGIAALTDAEVVLVLNPDIRLTAGAFDALLRALAIDGTGIAVPRIVDDAGALQHSLRRRPTLLRAAGEAVLGGTRAGRFDALGEMVVAPSAYERPAVVDWATGAAMLISRACLETVGRWDESFFLYSEETDFALRAAASGFATRYTPDATVVHLGGEAMTSPTLYRLLTLNRLELYRRNHHRAASAGYRAALTVNEALRAPFAPTHRAALRGLVAGASR